MGSRGSSVGGPSSPAPEGCLLQTHKAAVMIEPACKLPPQRAVGLHAGLQEGDVKSRSSGHQTSLRYRHGTGEFSAQTLNVFVACRRRGRDAKPRRHKHPGSGASVSLIPDLSGVNRELACRDKWLFLELSVGPILGRDSLCYC